MTQLQTSLARNQHKKHLFTAYTLSTLLMLLGFLTNLTSCGALNTQPLPTSLSIVGEATEVVNAQESKSTVILHIPMSGRTHSCGGAYIHPGVILTAWHCIAFFEYTPSLKVSFLYNIATEPTTEPQYNSQKNHTAPIEARILAVTSIGTNTDLGLAYFDPKPVLQAFEKLAKDIRPQTAALSTEPLTSLVESIIEGYGHTKDYYNSISTKAELHLRKTKVSLYPLSLLSQIAPEYHSWLKKIRAEAGYEYNTDEKYDLGFFLAPENPKNPNEADFYGCRGDSGSPLYANTNPQKPREIVAIMSGGATTKKSSQGLKNLYNKNTQLTLGWHNGKESSDSVHNCGLYANAVLIYPYAEEIRKKTIYAEELTGNTNK